MLIGVCMRCEEGLGRGTRWLVYQRRERSTEGFVFWRVWEMRGFEGVICDVTRVCGVYEGMRKLFVERLRK